MVRVMEALECVDWTGADGGPDEDEIVRELLGLDDDDDGKGEDGWGEMKSAEDGDEDGVLGGDTFEAMLGARRRDPLGAIGDEMQREMWGLREAIARGGVEDEEEDDEKGQELAVEELEALMGRLQAVRGMFNSSSPSFRQWRRAKSAWEMLCANDPCLLFRNGTRPATRREAPVSLKGNSRINEDVEGVTFASCTAHNNTYTPLLPPHCLATLPYQFSPS